MTNVHRLLVLCLAMVCLATSATTHALRAPSFHQPQEHPPNIALTEALVIGPVGRYGRFPVHRDAIELRMITDQWRAPAEGDSIVSVDGTDRVWRRAHAADNGWLQQEELRGGYVCWTVTQPAEQIMILSANGAAACNVNGDWRVGDLYQTGWTQLPVSLREGENILLFHVLRGGLQASLRPAIGPIEFNTSEITLPRLVVGERIDTVGAVVVINATHDWQSALTIRARCDALGIDRSLPMPAIPPCTIRKVRFDLASDLVPSEPGSADLSLHVMADDDVVLASATSSLRVVTRSDVIVRTFISEIDGSVQYYGVRLASNQDDADAASDRKGIILSLHGASVEAAHQASCYTAKHWAHLVTPTNRRPFGFDWEDWGRLDALEVLDHATATLNADPARVVVTGHSMGGHGTWHLGATYPDRFLALAPSAGWVSFFSYAGGVMHNTADPIEQMFHRASGPSHTLNLIENLAGLGLYILHGDADDNVPVSEARTMRMQLAHFHTDFAYYERPGAGHWWGNECMDWPPLMQFLQARTIGRDKPSERVMFHTAHPGISATYDWVTIAAQHKLHDRSNVTIAFNRQDRIIHGTTENVAVVGFDLLKLGGLPNRIQIDDGVFNFTQNKPKDSDHMLWLERLHVEQNSGWVLADAPSADAKNPVRNGLFKDAFRHRMVFVVGSQGSPEENDAALTKAKYDAETFWYRGNGSIDIMLDDAFIQTAQSHPDHNVILYGNADTNSAWPLLLRYAPVQVHRGAIDVGTRHLAGEDLACIMIRPRPGSSVASVGAVAGTSVKGMKLTSRLPVFVSGVAYPDFMIWSADALQSGMEGIRCAGFFGNDWSIEQGEVAWREVASEPHE